MTKETASILLDIAFYSGLLPIFLGLVKWRVINHPMRAIVILSIVSFASEQATFILRGQGIKSNVFLQIYYIIATGIYFYFYYKILKRPHFKRPLQFIFIITSCVSIYGWFISTNPNLSGALLTAHTVFLLVLGLIYFGHLFADTEPQPIFRNHLFWINSGLGFYAAGVLTLFISMDYLINVLKVDMYLFWSINNILNIVLHFVYFVGIWLSIATNE